MGTDTPGGGLVQELTLFSPGPSIYGGTDQVQRNIIGERVLGLPKEPGPAEGHAVPRPARQHVAARFGSVLDQLLATPGVQERCVLGSSFGFLALHGGLEAGTAEIAQAAAVASNASIYAVVQPDDMRWHIPSHAYEPSQSDALVAFLAHVELVVSVHGFGGLRGDDDRWITGLLGGAQPRARGGGRGAAPRRAARTTAGSTTSTASHSTCAACTATTR